VLHAANVARHTVIDFKKKKKRKEKKKEKKKSNLINNFGQVVQS
jgi:hypothetical protein